MNVKSTKHYFNTQANKEKQNNISIFIDEYRRVAVANQQPQYNQCYNPCYSNNSNYSNNRSSNNQPVNELNSFVNNINSLINSIKSLDNNIQGF